MATDLSASRMVDHVDAQTQPQDSLPNGDHEPVEQSMQHQDAANNDSFIENSSLLPKETTINVKEIAASSLDPNPSGPTPTDDVSSGIQPVADFLPKDAPTLSHPTPPPDQPLVTAEADVDTEMVNGESDAQSPARPQSLEPQSAPEPAQAPEIAEASEPVEAPEPVQASEIVQAPEPSLVRPREDDDDEADDERAAKRSKVDDESSEVLKADEQTTVLEPPAEPAATVTPGAEAAAPADVLMTDEGQPAPASVDAPADGPAPDAKQPVEPAVKPSVEAASAPDTQAQTAEAKYSTAPMTPAQHLALREKMKNLKKSKSAVWFLKPVDIVLLNIPAYPEIIKHPMDLGTIDTKLKDNQYHSVQDFVNDFDLIVNNCRTFNGDAHQVTQHAMNMEAYFRKAMDSVPGPDAPAPAQKAAKRSSPAVKAPPRRESRAAAAATSPADPQTFALQSDGMPLIRRESTLNNRPARAIKPPANREIPYAKPKRKEHQLELKFCEYVLDEIRGPKYAGINGAFLLPVDPVALNIPHYRQVIKHPMDLTTMSQKLKQGQYGNAKEFRKDFDLMIDNCLAFNPQGNPVRDFGIQLRRQFESIWNKKDQWERAHKPESQRATSASDDESAGEEDDEDDEPEDDKEQTIQALQKQLADMQNLLSGMGTKPSKTKKPKVKGSKPKSSNVVPAAQKTKVPAPKSKKSTKPKQVTYDEKQEISEAVGRMDDAQVAELTKIITQNCARYRDMEEMELEIDDLPNDVQALLLKYVRREFGRPKGASAADSPPDDGAFEDDGEFAPVRGGGGAAGKRKKHKPMGKREQAETISALKGKLDQFNRVGTSGSESPTNSSFNNTKAESSGDDESEESEEE